jgi:hypothetical protein
MARQLLKLQIDPDGGRLVSNSALTFAGLCFNPCIAAALAVEALRLCPSENIGLDTMDADSPLLGVVADNAKRALDP